MIHQVKELIMQNQPARDVQVFTVSQLNSRVKQLLEVSFGRIRIEGELSSFAKPSSGHWYFTLKDKQSEVRCAMFKSSASKVSFSPKDGDLVELSAQVSLYPQRGAYQLIVEHMKPAGEGALLQAFEELKNKLKQEGLFSPEYKKPIPRVSKVGLVTSSTGAALQDMLSILARRCPLIQVVIYPTQVQGETAGKSIIKAVELANTQKKADVLIVGRGGGSLEDLFCFNDEALARAIFASQLPIVSAVGHETDTCISDFVADLRAPTPSSAAELISPDQNEWLNQIACYRERNMHGMVNYLMQKREQVEQLNLRLRHPKDQIQGFMQHLDQLNYRLNQAGIKQLKQHKHILDLTKQRLLFQHPKVRLERQRMALLQLISRLKVAQKQKLSLQRHALARHAELLQSLSPLNIMARGYALVLNDANQALTSVSELKPNAQVNIRLKDGIANASINAVKTIKPSNK